MSEGIRWSRPSTPRTARNGNGPDAQARRELGSCAPSMTSWSRMPTISRPSSPPRWANRSPKRAARSCTARPTSSGSPRKQASYGDVIPGHQDDKRIMVIRQPVGVVGAITPWNSPDEMLARKVAPALAAAAPSSPSPPPRHRSRRWHWRCSPSARDCRADCSR